MNFDMKFADNVLLNLFCNNFIIITQVFLSKYAVMLKEEKIIETFFQTMKIQIIAFFFLISLKGIVKLKKEILNINLKQLEHHQLSSIFSKVKCCMKNTVLSFDLWKH